MAKNALSVDIENVSGEKNGKTYSYSKVIISGTQRQPTLTEAINYIDDHNVPVWGYLVAAVGYPGEHRDDPKYLVLYEWNEICPICADVKNIYGEKCPVCDRPWG